MDEKGDEEPLLVEEEQEDYLDDLTGLAEPKSAMMFSSSSAVLTI